MPAGNLLPHLFIFIIVSFGFVIAGKLKRPLAPGDFNPRVIHQKSMKELDFDIISDSTSSRHGRATAQSTRCGQESL